MKVLILVFALFFSGCAAKIHVTPPSTAAVKGSVSNIRISTNDAQTSNDEAIDAVLAAQLNTASLRKKLELLKANYPH